MSDFVEGENSEGHDQWLAQELDCPEYDLMLNSAFRLLLAVSDKRMAAIRFQGGPESVYNAEGLIPRYREGVGNVGEMFRYAIAGVRIARLRREFALIFNSVSSEINLKPGEAVDCARVLMGFDGTEKQ